MAIDVDYKLFNDNREMIDVLKNTQRKIINSNILDEDIIGGKLRSRLIEIIGLESKNKKFLHYDEDTAFIVQVSHPGGAFSKLLEILLAYNQGQIKNCIFVTQTYDLAVRRNQIKNPNSLRDGNRIYFETAVDTIESYANSFLDIPIGVLGIDIKE